MSTISAFDFNDDGTDTGQPPLLPLALAIRKQKGGGVGLGDRSVLPKASEAAASVPVNAMDQSTLPQSQTAARSPTLGGLAAGYDTQISEYQKQLQDLNKDPDYGDIAQAARQRGMMGVQSMGAALAAGMGPQDMQGLQKTMSAESMRQMLPQKVEGGEVDVSGQVHIDPGFKRQKQIETLRESINALEKQKLTAVTTEERLRAEALQHQQMNQLKEMQIQAMQEAARDRAAQARENAAIRRDALDAKNGPLSGKDRAQIEDRMGDDFRSQTKNYVTELDAARKILTIPTDRKWTPIEQQSAIVMLNKILDPGSVVREGEFDRVAQAQGVFQRAQLALERLKTGATLSPALAADIRNVAEFYNKASGQRMNMIAQDYTDRSKRRGLDARNVVGIYAPPEPAEGAAPGGPAAAPTGDVNVRKQSYYNQ
jgi:hypothetical protein